MRNILILSFLMIFLISCAQEERDKPAVDKAKGSVTANLPVYSNLTDEGSREEVAEKLREAQMPEEKICNFLLWAEEFNQLEGYNLQTGFTSMDGEMVFYVPRFSMAQRWAEKRGNYDDLLCRTVAFYLVEDFLSLTDSQSSTMMVCDKELMRGDREVIERNPAIMWTEDTKNKYYSVFQPVKTRTDCRNAEQRAAAVNSYWKTLELSFENNRPSLITVWGNVQGKDSSYIFSVHAGVLVEDGEDILFLEKISPLYPYQATIFKDRGQLVTYLVAKQQSFGADFGKIFVMENNILLH